MNNEVKKIKVSKQDKFLTKIRANDDKTEYDFKVEGGEVTFNELKKDSESTSRTFKLKAKKSSDTDEASNWKDVADEKIIYKEGLLRKGCHVTGKKMKIGGTEVEFKNEIDERLNTEVHSFTIISWVVGIFTLLVLGFGGWYLISSKEDKEEESL
ncbi:MAG: hypothetical protein GBAus27B_000168 [Mycoplasmataceae bacterium]|nr:MAG: hypothetical protein GBAus27B_000168 [Mycoplasmataceae bacterium]